MRSKGTIESIEEVSGPYATGGSWHAKDIVIDGTRCRFFTTAKVPVECAVGDIVEFDVKQKPNSQYMQYANLTVIVDLEQHAPLPEGFSTTPSPQSTIVKQVEAELLAEGKATVVYPAPKPKAIPYTPNHWELLDKEGLRAELVRAREGKAESYVIGQLINLIRYEEVSEKLTALIDVGSKIWIKLREELKQQ